MRYGPHLVFSFAALVSLRSAFAGGPNPGPDLITSDLTELQQQGRVGSVVGLAVSSRVCNKGNVGTIWLAMPNTNHPVHAHNFYRLKNDRFEQIGQGWMFHQFNALKMNFCGYGCDACCEPPCSAGSVLCGGCSSTTGIASAGQATQLGSRAWINPYTGVFPSNANDHTGHVHDAVQHKIRVDDADLAQELNGNNTAQYFAEVHYVSAHEYLPNNGIANNQFNNVSYRSFNVSGNAGGTYAFSINGANVLEEPALAAWDGATIVSFEPNPGTDGIGYLAYKVTLLPNKLWHYEYAVYNMNLDRAIGSVQIPIGDAKLSAIEFHAPMNPPGFPNDGTGGVGYSNAPWTYLNGTWSTDSFAVNANANAIRWGTLYNFRFDANVPPQNGTITLGMFKPGTPGSMSLAAQVPASAPACPADIAPLKSPNGTVDVDDLLLVINNWGSTGPNVADVTANGIVDVDDLLAVINAWGPCRQF